MSENKEIGFTSLTCWQKARELRLTIKDCVLSFPELEKYRLSDQLTRASRSVTNNIAEGYGRYHYKESVHFYFNARGSMFEILDHLIIAKDENLLSTEVFNNLSNSTLDCIKLLNGYINHIKNKSQNQS
jgi:four helix bundle protein